eukprot:GDKH01012219.1.p1 GENE.GDKH01012219.1~~GDKH01012219.1.p1  ORF type:complete len:203 (-),score=19.31 GDKH01012219.1:115-723(-)
MMSSEEMTPKPAAIQALEGFGRRLAQQYHKTAIYVTTRWIVFAFLVGIYCLRVAMVGGYYIVTYGLGVYMLNLVIGFLSPKFDEELEGPVLPTSSSEEFRPFQRQLPEFKFWTHAMKAFSVGTFMTFFAAFDLPVFWPILLFYFVFLFFLTMRQQIQHMIKYKYVPFSFGKQKYGDITRAKPTALPTQAVGGKTPKKKENIS